MELSHGEFNWRAWLYLFGAIPQLIFATRFLIQWGASEWRRQSYVPAIFWRLSFLGNVLMVIHAIIQLQYHVAIAQAANAVIAWRNLDLLRRRRCAFTTVVVLLCGAIAAVTLLFWWQVPQGPALWFRAPQLPHGGTTAQIAWTWHLWGSCGLLLFYSRFWIQWWQAERRGESYLGAAFWWCSCVGNGMLLLYFWQLGDPLHLYGAAIAMFPYLRNLALLRRQAPPTTSDAPTTAAPAERSHA